MRIRRRYKFGWSSVSRWVLGFRIYLATPDAALGPAGLDELLEPIEITFDPPIEETQRRPYGLDDAFWIGVELERDAGRVVIDPVERDNTGVSAPEVAFRAMRSSACCSVISAFQLSSLPATSATHNNRLATRPRPEMTSLSSAAGDAPGRRRLPVARRLFRHLRRGEERPQAASFHSSHGVSEGRRTSERRR